MARLAAQHTYQKKIKMMDRYYQNYPSHLFTVRVWQEELGDGQKEWRGKVQHVHTGEVRYFREWPALVAALLKMLSEPDPHAEVD
jgi:hypothetical protein